MREEDTVARVPKEARSGEVTWAGHSKCQHVEEGMLKHWVRPRQESTVTGMEWAKEGVTESESSGIARGRSCTDSDLDLIYT